MAFPRLAEFTSLPIVPWRVNFIETTRVGAARRRWSLIVGVAVLLAVCVSGQQAFAVAFPGDVPGTNIGASLPSGFEPSGAAYHPVLDRVFVCGDGGRIARMTTSGSSVTTWNVAGDLEGIAIADTTSTLVYVANEDDGSLKEFNTATSSVTRTFALTTAPAAPSVAALNAADIDALTDDNSSDGTGIEALTFVPDAAAPDGGVFWVGSQENGTIYKFRLSLASGGSTAVYLGKFKTWTAPHNDLAGLEYDWASGNVLAVWDNQDTIRALRPDGTVFRTWDVPSDSNDEEGLAFDGSRLFIARDPASDHEVFRYENFGGALPVTASAMSAE